MVDVSTNSTAQPQYLVDPATGLPVPGGGGGGDASAANQATQITAEQAMQATLGATTGAAVVTDANGTIQQYLRGLIVNTLALIARLPAALGAGGGLKVDGSGTALPVSGTVAATQSGTWNIGTVSGSLTVGTLPSLVAGSAVIGKVGIDQTSDGVTNLVAAKQSGTWTEANSAAIAASASVLDDWDETDRAKVNLVAGQAGVDGGSGAITAKTQRVTQAGFEYETVAASQTAQVLGATGATGDFLSHVILQPTTTAAGTCTILDNATVIYTYTTATLSDLRPIVVPINAISVSGAWKITTGANVTATAFGDFT